MSITSYLRQLTWTLRQRHRRSKFGSRPVLDLIDFGRRRCVVLDVGAHAGGFAGDVLVRAPMAEVHCFEPNSDVFGRLQAAADRYGMWAGSPRCLTNRCAVGSISETRELHVTQLTTASSLLVVSNSAKCGWPQADFTESRRECVSVIRLDEYLAEQGIAQVKLLKLDVQGYELEALRGCGNRLRQIEYIVAEVQFERLYESAPLWGDIVGYTRTQGFEPVVMDGFCFGPDGQPLQADILLRRNGASNAIEW
ncbi:MAG: FkbM family methyltransferase [Planctomycetaceae bacterium]|nr:FkbM family methyltransferase [Planctomycetaceae bacterium]